MELLQRKSVAQPRRIPVLVRASGPLAGTRYMLRDSTRIGRNRSNDIVMDGQDAGVVSSNHVEIRKEGRSYWVYDLGSTNGTYVDGRRVEKAALRAPCSIQLGLGGPELAFVEDELLAADLNQTMVIPSRTPEMDSLAGASAQLGRAGSAKAKEDERLLLEAISRARTARRAGIANQTMVIMRELVHAAVQHSARRHRRTIAALAVLVLMLGGYAWWRIQQLREAKLAIDAQIGALETKIAQQEQNPSEADQLISVLNQYQSQGRALESSSLWRIGTWQRENFVNHGIRLLLAEFGAEVYSVPPEFSESVNRFLKQYQGPDRPHMVHVLGEARPVLNRMRRIFEQNNLPPDLGYMVLVESGFDNNGASAAGAAGFWQFTPATARGYGLQVNSEVDERLNPDKATRAACKYIRELILDFGAGSSVMLALAAYNVGPAKVKAAIRHVKDPIKQRSFWYLYRVKALPQETRDYVPKVIAAMIIGRNPEKFGF